MTAPDGGEQRGAVRAEPSRKRVRVHLGGQLVADSYRPWLVWEKPYYPTYYLPLADVHAELVPTGETRRSPSRGDGTVLDVVTSTAKAPGAAVRYADSPIEALRDLVRLEWSAMDEWLEEDEPVYVHPRDPYKRVDVLHSSRHVRIELDGVTVADSRRPTVLFETGLPPRWYLRLSDVRMDLLRPSSHQTRCPYKGTAEYWSVDTGRTVHRDVVWTYRSPVAESQKIAGLACFFDERVDVYLDGELQPRPRTPFS
jgi:uncharacterized protein (DUF427 family)